ncbi:MAG TPA: SRPBCC family protein [Microbacterium sp.]|nr:SRPBCC family protein [Microbacterium sp.]
MLIRPGDVTVPVTVQTRSPLAPGELFAFVVPVDLALVFRGWGPFPGVRGTENQTGAWDRAGQSRSPQLSDGSTAFEQLTEYTKGHSFAYELSAFTGQMRHLVRGVRGEWTFTPDGTGTVVRWTYEFSPLAGRRFVIQWLVAPLWRRYMVSALRATVRESTNQAR